ncbi:hypothetical protein CISG_10336 [Coccidioides immitis RMSCC 3703]|uniref:Uncharacterized protein n=1 Tax=Coccidioides immitis RMSCC 3703 TaxID=454286 RepID=A0A0J8TLD6_COCIT|nr:hypothetical protein CISG_10336 [Coccidioides immitis RMSCC 3703]
MATLFIPFNSGRTITLPLPVPYTPTAVFTRPSSSKLNIAPLPFSRDNIYEQRELLPYYMTLSCNGWALRSLLHSTFFNPDVYCNLVGSWLEPAFEALEPILDAEDYTGLTILLTRRQPVLGPLWLGAILTGTATTILHAIRSGQWAVDLHAAAWTGTEQSFLTTKLSGPRAAKQSRINRDDECRLLFLTGCDGFSSVPVCPWKPFGSSALSDTEIAVRLHARCRGHGLPGIRQARRTSARTLGSTWETRMKNLVTKLALPEHQAYIPESKSVWDWLGGLYTAQKALKCLHTLHSPVNPELAVMALNVSPVAGLCVHQLKRQLDM